VSGLVKRRAELAGEIERTHEALTATIKRRIWIAPPGAIEGRPVCE